LQAAVGAAEEACEGKTGELEVVMAESAKQQKGWAAAMAEKADQATELEKVHTHTHTHTH
jgi:hypothetical protein